MTVRSRRDPVGRRQDILDAALTEFAIKGYHGVATATVALQAGVAIGTVFKIFHTKEGLANAVFCRSADRHEAVAEHFPILPSDAPRDQFRCHWRRLTDFYRQYPLDFRFYEQQSHEEFLSPESRRRQTALRLPIYRWVEAMQKQGALKKCAPAVLTAAVVGPFVRVAREAVDGNLEITETLISDLEGATWDAIAQR